MSPSARRSIRVLLAAAISCFLAGSLALAAARDPQAELVGEAQRVLARRCLSCHGGARVSGLDLRTREAALRGGNRGRGFLAGKPDESRLYQVVSGRGEVRMPPSGALPTEEQELLRRWIAAGAAWPGSSSSGPEGWALRDLVRPPVPRVKDRGWVRNPVDAFVLAKLETKGLQPAPPADPRTLIRRLSYDLTGLPPTPEEVEAFVRECAAERDTHHGDTETRSEARSGRAGERGSGSSKRSQPNVAQAVAPPRIGGSGDPNPERRTAQRAPGAYERLVDRYLASPRYGERWARHWLDVARFAESQGFERDKIRDNAWRYRDYVIRSLNEDKPYDRFIREQIAGDVLPDATRDSIVATGFLVAGPWDEVGNTQASAVMRARVREDELEDMVSATCQTFLGLTVNCARCHDHKFDPIPQRDYYRIQAALAGVRHGDRSILTPGEEQSRQAALGETAGGIAALQTQLAAVEAAGRARALFRRPELPAGPVSAPSPRLRWSFAAGAKDAAQSPELTLSGGAAISGGRLRLDGRDGQARSAPLAFEVAERTLEAWVDLADLNHGGGAALTLEALDGRTFDGIVFGERQSRKWTAGSDSFLRTRDLDAPEEATPPGYLVHVAVVYGPDRRITVYRNGTPYGESYTPAGPAGALRTYPAGASHVLFGLRHGAAAVPGAKAWLKGDVAEARLYDRALTPTEIEASFRSGPPVVTEAEALVALSPDERSQRDRLSAALAAAREEAGKLTAAPQAYAANPQAPPAVFVLKRGDIHQKGEPVQPGGLSCVRQLSPDFDLPPDAPEGQRRLKLADWIAARRNPLTPRVLVNRVWQYHFGRGLAASTSDFGVNGEPPSHPELLDWLASVFISGGGMKTGPGWSLKELHRLILTSNTYRMGVRFDAKAAGVDAEDRLLWRMPPRRLEAEEIRDAMLAVSGQLNPEAGGPGFRPFSVFVNNSSFYTYEDRIGPEYNRRSIYRTAVNSGSVPLLDAFDCPDPSVKTPRRGSTTTPLQALALLNDSFTLRQSRELARQVETAVGTDPARQAVLAYRRALGRPPAPEEGARAAAFIREHGLMPFCRVLFNSSEFVYVR